MSKRTERPDEQKPFDSRRTNRVTLVTPRNPAPAAAVPEPAPAAQDDTDQSVPSSSDSA